MLLSPESMQCHVEKCEIDAHLDNYSLIYGEEQVRRRLEHLRVLVVLLRVVGLSVCFEKLLLKKPLQSARVR